MSNHKIPETNTNDSLLDEQDKKITIGETPYRFIILLSFCLLNFSNAMQWVTYSSIADRFKAEYNLDQYQVDLLATIFFIAYPFANFPASYIIDNISPRLGVIDI
jgi:fucose permease